MAGSVRGPAGGRGFTYYELLIVTVIFLIMLMIGIPRVGGVVSQFRLRSAAWQLAGDLRLARQRAVTLRTRVRVCLSSCALTVPAGRYSVEIDRGTPSSPSWKSETGFAVRLPQDVDISTTATVTFATTGASSAGCYTLTNAVGSYQVLVIPVGQVRVDRGACP
jgi:type II secretory pathway pseudopilin PulG